MEKEDVMIPTPFQNRFSGSSGGIGYRSDTCGRSAQRNICGVLVVFDEAHHGVDCVRPLSMCYVAGGGARRRAAGKLRRLPTVAAGGSWAPCMGAEPGAEHVFFPIV